ncbi:MAG: hypothetical protein O7G85_14855, partial [Planctomycetota bacterium]|nr:hypothetical protein [Planctomycetota bacterium]
MCTLPAMIRPDFGRMPRMMILAILVACVPMGCQSTLTIEDPIATLHAPGQSPRFYKEAMRQLDVDPTNDAYLKVLKRIMWYPGFTVDMRQSAFDRLVEHDLDGLKVTIRRYLPRLTAWLWLNRLCDNIAQYEWIDLTPALVSSWARPSMSVDHESERPESRALTKMYGADKLPDVVFDLFVESRRVSDQGLRTRCWVLLHRLGYRDRLVAFVEAGEFVEDDFFLQDLHTAAIEMGIVPRNREEILWIRKLCKPEYAEFRSTCRQAIEATNVHRREDLELRDLP